MKANASVSVSVTIAGLVGLGAIVVLLLAGAVLGPILAVVLGLLAAVLLAGWVGLKMAEEAAWSGLLGLAGLVAGAALSASAAVPEGISGALCAIGGAGVAVAARAAVKAR